MPGLRNLCRAYGEMTIQGEKWVWDFVVEEPVKESQMPFGSGRWKASEKARWLNLPASAGVKGKESRDEG